MIWLPTHMEMLLLAIKKKKKSLFDSVSKLEHHTFTDVFKMYISNLNLFNELQT